MTAAPNSQRAEESVLGSILKDNALAPEIIGTLLEPEHFFFRPYRLIYERLVEAHYADEPMDAISIGEALGKKLSSMWDVEEREAVDRVFGLTTMPVVDGSTAIDHARVIKRHADYRALSLLGERIQRQALAEDEQPDVIASIASAAAMKIATDRLVSDDSKSYYQLGQEWVREQNRNIAAREQGIQLGAYFDLPFIDNFIKGLRPTELLIGGGEPGMGKSAAWWKAGERFAQKQLSKDDRIGTLIVSLEMGQEPSSDRLAQSVGRIEGEKLREGTITREELFSVAKSWAGQRDLPLWMNHSSMLRESQLRAIVVEAIRQHNVGLVIIDHFRKIRPDDSSLHGNEADDQIVSFLKSGLAKDLNIAVICIAHTVKSIERADKRPRMSDLRGSGMIAADADFVGFIYRPWVYATESQKDRNEVTVNDAEMIWEKARHAAGGTGEFHMNLSTMTIYG